MGMMQTMMNRMVISMSIQEKEEMMFKMMPMMMKDVDMVRMMPKMMPAMGRLLTVTGLVTFIIRVVKDPDIREKLEGVVEWLPEMSKKMQTMMAEIRPAMSALMTGMMDFMGGKVMPIMMPVMTEMMPMMMQDHMPNIMAKNETMKELVPQMMMEIIPHCVTDFSPMMAEPEKNAFFNRLESAMLTGNEIPSITDENPGHK